MTTAGQPVAFRVFDRPGDRGGMTFYADHLKPPRRERQADGADPAVSIKDAPTAEDGNHPIADHRDDRFSLWSVDLKEGARIELECKAADAFLNAVLSGDDTRFSPEDQIAADWLEIEGDATKAGPAIHPSPCQLMNTIQPVMTGDERDQEIS